MTTTQNLSAILTPKFPPPTYIEEGNIHFCKCGSSLKIHFLFFPSENCYQPNCDRYWKGFPSEDYVENNASYINGELNMYY
jgi:hypothetical protein